MALFGDFVVIQGDISKRMGDGANLWQKKFTTADVHSKGYSFLQFMVKGLVSTTEEVDVKINGKSVGKIFPYYGAKEDHWYTQIINIGGKVLHHDKDNILQIQAVTWEGTKPSNVYDDFHLRDMVLFFQQMEVGP